MIASTARNDSARAIASKVARRAEAPLDDIPYLSAGRGAGISANYWESTASGTSSKRSTSTRPRSVIFRAGITDSARNDIVWNGCG